MLNHLKRFITVTIVVACATTCYSQAPASKKNQPTAKKTATTKQYAYETVPDDPLKARIYTLDNGLKVYISVYKDEPRFQSMIGVKAGSKTDPHDATGLAH